VETEDIILLCKPNELTRERRGYYKAFSQQVATKTLPPSQYEDFLEEANLFSNRLAAALFIHPDASAFLPSWLPYSKTPTACFQIDTFNGLEKRIQWSMLFDYVFVFHPNLEKHFLKAGHHRAICLPHAVEANLFANVSGQRVYEVGWVGNLEGTLYSTRRRYIGKLQQNFKMNETDRHYSPEEMSIIYKQSKIVVNISRDDYLEDANLRCFEVMAAGALLITSSPTELSDLGFVAGTHFVSYQKEAELYQLVRFYIEHDDERNKIARAGRILVMKEHTYDCRVKKILNLLQEDEGKLFAPARKWTQVQVHKVYIHYFAKHLMLDPAIEELRKLQPLSKGAALCSLPLLVKAFIRSLQLSLQGFYNH
jgi:Glycosyl transferases group 1